MNDLAKKEEAGVFKNEDSHITAIAKIAASGASTEVIEQMKSLVEWDDARKSRMAFDSAFSNAKRKFKSAKKSGFNAHLKAAYSTLEDLDEATRDALTEFGLSWRHVPATLPGDITSVRCILSHRDGHREEAELVAPSYSMTNNAVNKLQSTGIVLMYLQRMTLRAILGIVSSDFDNDGNGSEQFEKITQKQSADLQSLAEEVKADIPKFLSYLSNASKSTISSIDDIPISLFHDAVSLLEKKRK